MTTSVVLVVWVRLVAGGGASSAADRRRGPAGRRRWLADARRVRADPDRPERRAAIGVAPLRESATVFAAAWGSVRLGEAVTGRETVRRIGASVLIVAGALLLALGG